MSPVAAILVASGLCIAALVAWVVIAERLDPAPAGKHARPFADPADIADPDGEAYVAQLRTAGRLPYITDEAAWWDEPAPSGRVEVLPASPGYDEPPPGWRDDPRAQPATGFDTSPAAVASLYDALMALPLVSIVPADDEDDPAIDDTGQIPHAVGTWGKTAPQLADEMAARYLT